MVIYFYVSEREASMFLFASYLKLCKINNNSNNNNSNNNKDL